MTLFRFISYIEPFGVIARLHKEQVNFTADGLLQLRTTSGVEAPVFQQWKTLQKMLRQAKTPGDLGAVWIERLKPGQVTEWAQQDDSDLIRLTLPLLTNPGAREYCLHETVHMEAGTLWWHNHMQQHCSANWGEHQRIHLWVEFHKIKDDASE